MFEEREELAALAGYARKGDENVAIERIGKGGIPSTPRLDTPARSSGSAFSVERPSPSASSSIAAASPARPWERVRRGELSINDYLDIKVDQATSHLRDLPAAALREVRA